MVQFLRSYAPFIGYLAVVATSLLVLGFVLWNALT